MDFWRGEAYQRFFDFLDSKGGFYYEVNEFQHAQFHILIARTITAMGRRAYP